MKVKRKALIGLMALSLLGGIGGALALTNNSATYTGDQGTYDQAIYLGWGASNTQSVEISPVQNLAANTAQYVPLQASSKSTKTVAGTVTVGFSLAVQTGNYHIEGLTVTVYDTATTLVTENYETAIASATLKATLTKTATSGNATFTVSAAAAHQTDRCYIIKVLWDGSSDRASGHEAYTLGATLTISQSFAA